jgi:hypothetical protein
VEADLVTYAKTKVLTALHCAGDAAPQWPLGNR